jgi:hypothetical protein
MVYSVTWYTGIKQASFTYRMSGAFTVHACTGSFSLIRNAWDRKCLGFCIFSDFGILAYQNETAWGWKPNLNAKSIYVSYTAYVYIGFIYGIKTNWALNLITTSNSVLNLFTSIYICTALCSCRHANIFGFWKFSDFRMSDKGYSICIWLLSP